MLTQVDVMSTNTSGETHLLRRSSWKAEAIRRGDIKISSPIPIAEDVLPVKDIEEKASAEKDQVEGSPPHHVDAPKNTSQDLSKHELAPLSVPPNLAKEHVTPSSHDDAAPIEVPPREQEVIHPTPSQPRQNLLAPPAQGQSDDMHQRSATDPNVLAYNPPSPYPSINKGSTKGNSKKRKSGLRNVFRKMFGRRSRDESMDREVESEVQSRSHSHHISDPGLLRATSERQPARRGQRISEIPVQEPKPLNPLGQHLPFPMNVNAPQEVSPPHEYLTFEIPSPELGRRRATLPGILPDPDTQSLDGRMKQRLETWEERNDESSIPSPQIGIALSSPPGSTLQSKRRSRSASALRELAKEQSFVGRRRSSEIRHWRASYASASLYSNNRPATAQTVDTVMSTATAKDMEEHVKMSEAPVPIAPVEPESSRTPIPQQDQDLSEIRLPVEAFNFGNLKSGFSDDEESEQPPTEEQSLTHSPSPLHEAEQEEKPRRLSIEDRVKNLEEGLRSLETSVHRLSNRNNRQTIILENAPKGRRDSSRNHSSSSRSERQGSRHSSQSRSPSQTLPFREQEERRTSSSPVPAPSSLYNDAKPRAEDPQRPQTAVHYSTLLTHLTSLQNALTQERHSRKILESHVMHLQRELSDLRSLVNRLVHNSSRSEHYPTPSPDTLPSSSCASGRSADINVPGRCDEEKMPTPRASRRGFSAGEDSGITDMSRGSDDGFGSGATTARGRYAGSGYSSSKDDLISNTKSEKDTGEAVGSPEVWATPKEEGEFVLSDRGEDEMF